MARERESALGLRCSRKTWRRFKVTLTRSYPARLRKHRCRISERCHSYFQTYITTSLVLRWKFQITESCIMILCRIQQASHQRLPPPDGMELDALPFSSIPNFFRQSGQYHFALLGGISSRPTHWRWNHSLSHYLHNVSTPYERRASTTKESR